MIARACTGRLIAAPTDTNGSAVWFVGASIARPFVITSECNERGNLLKKTRQTPRLFVCLKFNACDDFFEFGISKQKIFGQPFPISGGGYVRLMNWEFMKSVIHQYITTNDYYVFYLHPFELTRQKIPLLKKLKSYDKYYLKAGIQTYGKHIEQLIKMLKTNGYEFVTFEELSLILEK